MVSAREGEQSHLLMHPSSSSTNSYKRYYDDGMEGAENDNDVDADTEDDSRRHKYRNRNNENHLPGDDTTSHHRRRLPLQLPQQSFLSPGTHPFTPVILAIIGTAITLLTFMLAHTNTISVNVLLPSLLLGKSKSGKKKVISAANECEHDKLYSKHTLKAAYDLPFSALFRDTKSQSKFEASAVTIVNGSVYSVCDSSYSISKFTLDLIPFSEHNVQIGNPTREDSNGGGGGGEEEEESGYEGIFEHEGIFYVVRESVFHYHTSDDNDDDDDDSVKRRKKKKKNDSSIGDYHAIIEELRLTSDDDYTVIRECQCEYTFEGDSKVS